MLLIQQGAKALLYALIFMDVGFLDALGLQDHGLNSRTLYSLQWEIRLNSERMAFIKKECLPPIGSFAELATCTGADM